MPVSARGPGLGLGYSPLTPGDNINFLSPGGSSLSPAGARARPGGNNTTEGGRQGHPYVNVNTRDMYLCIATRGVTAQVVRQLISQLHVITLTSSNTSSNAPYQHTQATTL